MKAFSSTASGGEGKAKIFRFFTGFCDDMGASDLSRRSGRDGAYWGIQMSGKGKKVVTVVAKFYFYQHASNQLILNVEFCDQQLWRDHIVRYSAGVNWLWFT